MIGRGQAVRAGRFAPPPVVLLDVFSSGLAIARRMNRLGGDVTLIAPPGQWEMRTRSVRAAHELNIGVGWVRLLNRIAQEVTEAVVIPATDRACEFLLDARRRLPPNLHFFEREGTAHRALMNKETATEIARRAGVRVPFSLRLDRPEDLQRLDGDVPWPCVVRAVLGRPFRAYMLTDRDEAQRRLAEPLSAGVPVLLSQYIPGGDGDVEEAVQVRLADGSYPISFGVRKLRQAPPGFGETALGESSLLPEATELARQVLDAAGFVGVAGVEVKRDARTGERWFLEANVRVPNQWGLGDACGVDATQRLVSVLAGRPLPEQPPLRPGVRFVATEKDIPLLLRSMRPEPLRSWPRLVAGHLRPYLGAGERTVLSLRDPVPAAAWVRYRGGRLFGRT